MVGREVLEDKHLYSLKGPIKIIGISTANRSKYGCAREDPISFEILKISLKEAEKAGAKTELIDLRDLRIGACKECYSSCPAQCRFNEKVHMCDCYPRKSPTLFDENGEAFPLDEAYSKFDKREFLRTIKDSHAYDPGDDMHVVYKAMMEADGIIFAGFTSFYSRPALMQTMISRLCALDGGVEELWGDGKNLENSRRYAKNSKAEYKQRLYGKFAAFINSSKEGDSVTPDLMKACTMMGMRIIPLGVAYVVSWYNDPTHKTDREKSLEDPYAIHLAKHIGRTMVSEIKNSDRRYGVSSGIV